MRNPVQLIRPRKALKAVIKIQSSNVFQGLQVLRPYRIIAAHKLHIRVFVHHA